MKVRARMETRSAFAGFGTRIRAGTDRALDKQADRAVAAIVDRLPVGDGESGVLPGHLRETIRRGRVQTYKKGRREVNITSNDPTLLFLELGTLGARTRKIKGKDRQARTREIRRKFLRQTAEGRRTGIKPRYFVRDALRATGLGPGLVDTIRRELGSLAR